MQVASSVAGDSGSTRECMLGYLLLDMAYLHIPELFGITGSFFFNIYLFNLERHERGRDTGRGRRRLPMGAPSQDPGITT